MSQLNLQQILSGDNLSIVMEKINYNFDQLILNGGGPQGLRGILGAPGLPGQQGEIGLTGPQGEEGTHLYTDQLSPTLYPFGTGGEILPRIDDVFIEAQSSYISVWQLSATGASSSYWQLIDTMIAPGGGFSKIVHDSFLGASASADRITNDPSISGKFLFGSPGALYGTAPAASITGGLTIIDPGFSPISSAGPTKLVPELSDGYPGPDYDSLMIFAAERNQIRLVTTAMQNATRFNEGGGVIHNLGVEPSGQIYSILNGDFLGNKHFGLKLNSNRPLKTLMYGDTENRLGVGVDYYAALNATLTVQQTLAVGDSTGFTLAAAGATFTNSLGAIIEGNLSVGRNRNTLATGGFYNRPGSFGASIKVDTDESAILSSAVSEMYFGKNMYQKGLTVNTASDWFRFKLDSFQNISNPGFRKFTLTGHYEDLFLGTPIPKERAIMTSKLVYAGIFNPEYSVTGIDNTDPTATFEVGLQEYPSGRIGIGNPAGGGSAGWMSSYLSFNLLRIPGQDNWTRKGDGAHNGGKTFWTYPDGGLALSFFPSTSGLDVSGITDIDVYGKTRVNWTPTGQYIMSETNIASQYAGLDTALALDFGGIGTTGYGASGFRRSVAIFGNGISTSQYGSPLIFTHNGYHQNAARQATSGWLADSDFGPVSPQYTFWGSDLHGLFLSNGSSANGGNFNSASVGIASNGAAMITAIGDTGRLGILTKNPHERLQIGDRTVFHDGGVKFFGYNMYYDGAGIKRIFGSTASGGTQQGSAAFGFADTEILTSSLPSLTRFTKIGTTIFNIAKGAGGTSSYVPSDNSGLTYAGTKLTPALTAPSTAGVTAAGWYNFAPVTPQLGIGLAYDNDSATSGNRGTINIAAQMRIKPAVNAVPPTGPFGITIEDQYNIGLYSFDGYPVGALFTSGGNPSTGNVKNMGLTFIGTGGNAINQDISILYATSDNDLTATYKRRANFGAGFRLGVNTVPNDQPSALASGHYDLASLVVGAYTEQVPLDVFQTAIFKGSLIIDQSPHSPGNGGNLGLVFKDNTITTTYKTGPRPNVKNYYGDWGIQYTKLDAERAGLNFWIPSGANNVLWLDDIGCVGIGTINFLIQTALNSNNIMGQGYEQGGSTDNGATNFWSAAGYRLLSPDGQVGFPSGTGALFIAKLAVNGLTKQFGLLNVSDMRLKDEKCRLLPGSALDKISRLEPVLYSWKESIENGLAGKTELGFFAQEVKEVMPEAVHITKSEKFEDEHILEYHAIFTMSVGAIKDLKILVEEKEEKIKNLESKLSKIEELLSKHGIK